MSSSRFAIEPAASGHLAGPSGAHFWRRIIQNGPVDAPAVKPAAEHLAKIADRSRTLADRRDDPLLDLARRDDDGRCEGSLHAICRRLYKIDLAVMPLPASPMDTYTGFECPGTATLTTRIE